MKTNILSYLEEGAARWPERVILAGEDTQLTFRQLLHTARGVGTGLLARRLQGRRVGVLLARSPQAFGVMLGAVYAGCCFAALDPELPGNRLTGILQTLDPGAVVCDSLGAQALAQAEGDWRSLSAQALCQTQANDRALERVRATQTDRDPAYIVFTSGSTGNPKGVVGCHRGVIDYIEGLCQALAFDCDPVFGSQAPLQVDAWLKELFPALKFGGRVELLPRRLFLTPVALVEYLNSHRVNTLCWVSSALALVSSLGTLEQEKPLYVTTVAFASEVMPPQQLGKWRQALPDARFYNLYGPTEATGICCCYQVDRPFAPGDRIPIGKPLPNTEVFLLGEENRESAPGEPGEICIRGSRLALGYWGRDQGGFCPDPRDRGWPERIYRTGDLGCRNSRGELEFLGRRDSQIKHMGYRVELGEIEARALSCPGVGEAGCAYLDGSIRLWYAGTAQPDQLSHWLRKGLPKYMIPHRLHRLEALPRLPNGKLDRKALGENRQK